MKYKLLLPELVLTAACLFPETATKRARATTRNLLNVPYGDGEGEKLDIYFPDTGSEGEQRGLVAPGQSSARGPASLSPALCLVLQPCRSLCSFTEGTGRVAGGSEIWKRRDEGRFLFPWPLSFLFLDLLLQMTAHGAWGGLAGGKCVLSQCGGRKSESKVSGLCSLQRPLGRSCPCLLPLLVALGVRGLWLHHSRLSPCLHVAFMCPRLGSPPLSAYNGTSHQV